MTNIPKIVGWALISIGIILISWTLFYSYNIFTAKVQAPEFFTTPKQVEAVAQKGKPGTQEEMEAQVGQMIGDQLQGIIPPNTVSQMLNLTVWSMLAFVLLFGGTQISNIGINLARK